MTTAHDEHVQDLDGRAAGDRGEDESISDATPSLRPATGPDAERRRGPTRIDVVAGLGLLGLVAGTGLSLPATIAASALAAVTSPLVRVDLAERRLPDVLVLVVLVGTTAGVVAAVAGGAGVSAARACLLGLVVLAACVPLVHGGGLGAGDAKLAGVGVVAAALASPSAPLIWLVAVALLGGVHGAVAVVRRRDTSRTRVAIPFGPVLLVGWWLAVAAATLLDGS